VIDLTETAPSPEQLLQNTLSLTELLVAYQDGRTIIMAVPQPSIYALDIAGLRAETLRLARAKLSALDVLATNGSPDRCRPCPATASASKRRPTRSSSSWVEFPLPLRRRVVPPYPRPMSLRSELNTGSGKNKAMDNRMYYSLTDEFAFYFRGDQSGMERLLQFVREQRIGIGKKTTLLRNHPKSTAPGRSPCSANDDRWSR
jgi:hypothetical protein